MRALPAKAGNWRKAKKARTSSLFPLHHPPPPANRNGHTHQAKGRDCLTLIIGLYGHGKELGFLHHEPLGF